MIVNLILVIWMSYQCSIGKNLIYADCNALSEKF